MRLISTARGRRLLFVAVVVVALVLPLVASLVTRARIDSSGTDVEATVVETTRKGDSYLVIFRFPKDVDPDQDAYSATVTKASYERAVESRKITVRVLDGRPEAHRADGEIRSATQYVVMGVGILLVSVVGWWWAYRGRRRPTVRIRADAPLEAAGLDDVGTLGRTTGDIYEAVGTVVSADDHEVVLDVGEREVVVLLAGHPNPVPVGSPARARGPLVG
jgi:hypothetical protein